MGGLDLTSFGIGNWEARLFILNFLFLFVYGTFTSCNSARGVLNTSVFVCIMESA